MRGSAHAHGEHRYKRFGTDECIFQMFFNVYNLPSPSCKNTDLTQEMILEHLELK